jgi:hypothetical protein
MPDHVFDVARELNDVAYLKDVVAATAVPPAWTRLEPTTETTQLEATIQAPLHDPLWLLARQWQFGEWQAENAGTPLAVEVHTRTRVLDGYSPGPADKRQHYDVLGDAPLAAHIESEAPPASAADHLQLALLAAAALRRALAAADLDAALADLTAGYPVPDAAAGERPLDPSAVVLGTLLADALPDGLALAGDVTADGKLSGKAKTVAAAHAGLGDVLAGWRAQLAPLVDVPGTGDRSWVADRLEHQGRLADAHGRGTVLGTERLRGEDWDWPAFDVVADPERHPKGTPAEHAARPAAVRYAGQPAERYWEFEDGAVDLGAIQTEPHDLARLLLVEFASVYGGDWQLVPLTLRPGSLTEVDEVSYTTSFGDRYVVRSGTKAADPASLFVLSVAGGGIFDALFLPEQPGRAVTGPPLEEVQLLIDEVANLAWAIERVTQGASGEPFRRTDPVPPLPQARPDADLTYVLQTDVPANWIPLVPQPDGTRGHVLVQAGLSDEQDHTATGRLLGGGAHPHDLVIRGGELPREGLVLRRVPCVARGLDGRYHAWTARRVVIGRGEGRSGLAFDAMLKRDTAAQA